MPFNEKAVEERHFNKIASVKLLDSLYKLTMKINPWWALLTFGSLSEKTGNGVNSGEYYHGRRRSASDDLNKINLPSIDWQAPLLANYQSGIYVLSNSFRSLSTYETIEQCYAPRMRSTIRRSLAKTYDIDEPDISPKSLKGSVELAVVDPPFLNEVKHTLLSLTTTDFYKVTDHKVVQTLTSNSPFNQGKALPKGLHFRRGCTLQAIWFSTIRTVKNENRWQARQWFRIVGVMGWWPQQIQSKF